MATQKKTTKKKTVAKDETVEIENTKVVNAEEPVVKKAPKKIWKFDDTVMVNVQSNVFGELIYINSRTGDKVIWGEFGDIQIMTIGDLRAMRGTQRAFFENNWIFVTEVVDEGYEDAKPEDVYKALMVSQFYSDSLNPENFNRIFTVSDYELERIVSRMSDNAKMNLVIASNEAIQSGVLDSLRRIRQLENLLGCELVEMP